MVTPMMSPSMTGLTDWPSPVIERIRSLGPKSPKEMNRIQRRLTRAGYNSLTAAIIFAAAEMVMPLVVGILPFFFFDVQRALDLRRSSPGLPVTCFPASS